VDIERSGVCVRSTVSYVAKRFRYFGELGLHDSRRFNGKSKVTDSMLLRLLELVHGSPQDLGWARPTWTRELLVIQLHKETGVRLALATLSSYLRFMGIRWGRPRPYVGCPWSRRRRQKRIRELRALVEELSADEVLLYQDEVDIHLNPKIGPDWMPRGTQKGVRTPGKNEKRYLAGALDRRSGRVYWVEGERKRSQLFIELLDQLSLRLRRYRRIHLVIDNYIIHSSKITQRALQKYEGRIVLHFLPPYCPNENPIERLWQDLHANVTRNHRCNTIRQLMHEVRNYLVAVQPYPGTKAALRRAV
jgi:transposase